MHIVFAASYHAGIFEVHAELVVRGVFSRAWHLQSREGWVLSVANVPYNGPMAVRVGQPLDKLPVRPGEVARLGEGAIDIGRVRVTLDGAAEWHPRELRGSRSGPVGALRRDVDAVLECAAVWNRREGRGGRELSRWAHRVAREWDEGGPPRGAAPTGDLRPMARTGATRMQGVDADSGSAAWLRRAGGEIEGLARCLRRDDVTGAGRHARGLLGLGPGLTPAGDDFLCGLLAGLRAFLPEWPGLSPLARGIVRSAPGRTTALSHTLLAQAAQGVVVEPLAVVLCSLGTGKGVHGLDELLDIGHSSGSDILAGACLAAMIAGEREEIGDPAMVAPA